MRPRIRCSTNERLNWIEPAPCEAEVFQEQGAATRRSFPRPWQTLNGIVGVTTVTAVQDYIYLGEVLREHAARNLGFDRDLQNLQLMAGTEGNPPPSRELPLRLDPPWSGDGPASPPSCAGQHSRPAQTKKKTPTSYNTHGPWTSFFSARCRRLSPGDRGLWKKRAKSQRPIAAFRRPSALFLMAHDP